MENLKKKLEYFIKDIYYMIPLILTAILSFGFAITHYTINTDSLSDNRYYSGNYLLAQERFRTCTDSQNI